MSVTPIPGSPSAGEQQPTAPSRAYRWWKQVSSGHSWLARRIHDIRMAPTYGWRLMAGWIKTVFLIATGAAVIASAYGIGTALIDAARALPWTVPTAADQSGLLATIDQPVRHYLTQHTAGLPITATTAYGTWQAIGALSLVLGFFHSSGARLTWTVWGAATAGMAWAASPASGREVAVGITLLTWTALSLLALRGLSLTPAAFINVNVQAPPAPEVEVHAEIHLPKPEPTTYRPYDPTRHQPPSAN